MTTKRLLVIGVAVAACLAIIVILAVFLFLRGLSRPGEATAQFVPASVDGYISFNLRPGVSQLRRAQKVLDQWQTDDVIDWREDLLDELEDETDIHFLDDITPWIGTDVSLVLMDANPDQPEWVFMAQISDRDAAEDFMDDLVSYLEEELYAEFDRDRGSDLDLWVVDDEEVALGLSDDYLFIGDSEETIEDMVDNLRSPPSKPLAEDEAFKEAREALPSDRVMFAFLPTDDIIGAIEENIDPYGDKEELFRQVERNTPEYVAVSASFVDGGIRLDVVAESPSDAFVFDNENHLRATESLPADTTALLSMVGIDQAWQEFRDSMEELDPYTREEFDDLLNQFEDETGVDLERDIVDSLTGELAIALLPSDFDFEVDPIGIVEILLLAGIEDSEDILDALDALTETLEDEGLDIDRDSLGNDELVTVRVDERSFEDYEPGYVVTEEWAVAGSNIDGLEAFHDTVMGNADSLTSNTQFRRLLDMTPNPLHLVFFVDLAALLEMVEDSLDNDLLYDYRRDVEPFVEELGGLIVGGSMTEDRLHFSMVLTLQER